MNQRLAVFLLSLALLVYWLATVKLNLHETPRYIAIIIAVGWLFYELCKKPEP